MGNVQQQLKVNYQTVNTPVPQIKSEEIEFGLTIYLTDTFGYFTRIWIFDEQLKIVARPEDVKGQTFTRKYKLPGGYYTVRLEINGQIEDNTVELFYDLICTIGYDLISGKRLNTPKLYSSALLDNDMGYASSHEYYTNPAIEISKKESFLLASPYPLDSGLFIFLRYPTTDIFTQTFNGKAYWESFSLLDRYGKILLTFPDHCIQDKAGYIGFNAALKPDLYFLKYDGKISRMMPVYVYENWYTQFFMTVAEQPLFGTIRIFLSEQKEFNPSEKNNYYTDICLNKLQNDDLIIDDELLRNISYGKYRSPMLGLLGAYLYLKSSETKDDELFKIIVTNLQQQILKNSANSPDIWALNLLSYQHFNKTISENEKKSIEGTPMLRVAYDAIRNSSIQYPWLIPEGTLNDYIAENQIFDSPYNTFISTIEIRYEEDLISGSAGNAHIPADYAPIQLDLDMDYDEGDEDTETSGQGGSEAYTEGFNKGSIRPDNLFEFKSTLQDALDDANSDDELSKRTKIQGIPIEPIEFDLYDKNRLTELLSKPSEIGRTGYAIVNEIFKKQDVSDTEIAGNLNLPLNTVSRIRKQLSL